MSYAPRFVVSTKPEPEFVNLLKEPRNRFPAWQAGTTTLFDVPAYQATKAAVVNSLESIPGLLNSLKIRAQAPDVICGKEGPQRC